MILECERRRQAEEGAGTAGGEVGCRLGGAKDGYSEAARLAEQWCMTR